MLTSSRNAEFTAAKSAMQMHEAVTSGAFISATSKTADEERRSTRNHAMPPTTPSTSGISAALPHTRPWVMVSRTAATHAIIHTVPTTPMRPLRSAGGACGIRRYDATVVTTPIAVSTTKKLCSDRLCTISPPPIIPATMPTPVPMTRTATAMAMPLSPRPRRRNPSGSTWAAPPKPIRAQPTRRVG